MPDCVYTVYHMMTYACLAVQQTPLHSHSQVTASAFCRWWYLNYTPVWGCMLKVT